MPVFNRLSRFRFREVLRTEVYGDLTFPGGERGENLRYRMGLRACPETVLRASGSQMRCELA